MVGRRIWAVVFQSTLPMRGATAYATESSGGRPISIHTPHAGSDTTTAGNVIIGGVISIHTPHAGSDMCGLLACHGRPISIHTPHAGSDSKYS